MEYALQTSGLCKSFGGRLAVNKVNLNVKRGDICGFIGENGAGKTTLMRMVCGLAAPTSGGILLFGSAAAEQRKRLGCTLESPAFYPSMSARENMEAQMALLGIKDDSAMRLLNMVGLAYTGNKKAKDFSLGMKQRLVIAFTLLGNPDFLILDEPTNGLDPMGIKDMRDLFHYLNTEKGITILISSHILGELEKIASSYAIINHGSIIDEFRATEIADRCAKRLLVRTDNNDKVVEILRNRFPAAKIERTFEGVSITNCNEDSSKIYALLVNEGITVSELFTQTESLENYFIKIMGGKQQYV